MKNEIKKVKKETSKKKKQFNTDSTNKFVEETYGIAKTKIGKTELASIDKYLKQEMKFAEALVESSVDGILAFDSNKRLTVWSLSMQYLTGLNKEEVLGTNIFKALPFLKKLHEDENVTKAFSGRAATSKDIPFQITTTGKQGFFQIRYSPLFSPEGEVIGGLAIFRDVTRHKQFDESLKKLNEDLELKVEERTAALHHSNQKLKQEISGHLEALKRINFDNRLLKLLTTKNNRKEYLDAVVKLIHGWTGCSCVGIRVKNDYGFIPYESYIGFSNQFWQSENYLSLNKDNCACIRVIQGKLEPVDKKMVTPMGSFCCNNTQSFVKTLNNKEEEECYRGVCVKTGYASVAVIPIKLEDKIIGAIHLADRRENKVPQQTIELLETLTPLIGEGINKFNYKDQLLANNTLLEKFFSGTHYQVAYLDTNFNFIRVNPAFAKADAHKPDYYVGKNHFDLFPNEENEVIFQKVITSSKPYIAYAKSFEYSKNPERGTSFWDWNLYPILGQDNKTQALLLILVDVTERHKATERLLDAYQHVGMINRQIGILLEINKQCNEKDRQHILKLILQSAKTLAQAKMVGIYIFDNKLDNFRLLDYSGMQVKPQNNFDALTFSDDTVKQLKSGQKIYGNTTELNLAKFNIHDKLKGYLIVPIICEQKLKGLFVFGLANREKLNSQELDFCELFVHQSAHALENIGVLN